MKQIKKTAGEKREFYIAEKLWNKANVKHNQCNFPIKEKEKEKKKLKHKKAKKEGEVNRKNESE